MASLQLLTLARWPKPIDMQSNMIDCTDISTLAFLCLFLYAVVKKYTLGVIHKLRLQEDMGRYKPKNFNFHKVETDCQ